MAEEVKLFGTWGSPVSRRVEIGLQIKGVHYDFIDEDMKNKSALLLKYNPIHKKVPVLLHNGKPIAESLIILEYIDEAFPGPSILPQDPYERAQARFWAKFIDEKCMPAMWQACMSRGEEQKKAEEEAKQLLKILENEIKEKKFFGGDKIGLVDIAGCFIAHWFGIAAELVGLQLIITEENFPKLRKWADEFCNCSIVKENLPHKDKLVELFKALQNASKGT